MTFTDAPLRTVAVVLAGGVGQRVGLKIPKQLVKIAGKPIIEHTLEVFQSAPEVDEIVVAMPAGLTDEVHKIITARGFDKVSQVVEGGAERTDTTARALAAIGGGECNVLLHDAVRPLLEPRIITDCVTALRHHEAVDVAIPSSDTIISVDGDTVASVPDRSTLRRGQTPQCFRLSVIRRAYELAAADPEFTSASATDDCSVVLRYLPDVPIYVVPGSAHNMKITYPLDVHIADKLFQLNSAAAPAPAGPDEYANALAAATIVVFGGSYGIGAEICRLAREFGANVYTFSRSHTGTYVEEPQQVEKALAQVYRETGRIDHVVNTAGVLRMGKLADADDAMVSESVNINYVAPINVARAAIHYLRESRGCLLLYTSSSYTRGRANYSLYSSTKAAVVNLTQALADEWSELGVRVNCVNPERTRTPMRERAFGHEPPDSLLSVHAVALTSIDVLLSDITGSVIDVRRIDPMDGDAAARHSTNTDTTARRAPTASPHCDTEQTAVTSEG